MGLLDPWLTERDRYLDGHSRTKRGREYDSQRSKLYKAERKCSRGKRLDSVSEMQDYVDDITKRQWWRRRFVVRKIEVKDGRGRKKACGNWNNSTWSYIKMPRWSRTELIILHEIGHTTVEPPHAWHGRLYAKTFLELVRWRMGEEAYNALLEAYRECNVRYYPHNKVQT